MTTTKLPAWVVERCRSKALALGDRYDRHFVSDALAEFLAILEERGLRVVPNRPSTEMIGASGLGGQYTAQAWAEGTWRDMLAAAPPLAELLAEPEDDDAT